MCVKLLAYYVYYAHNTHIRDVRHLVDPARLQALILLLSSLFRGPGADRQYRTARRPRETVRGDTLLTTSQALTRVPCTVFMGSEILQCKSQERNKIKRRIQYVSRLGGAAGSTRRY